jgi:hypothetical protein
MSEQRGTWVKTACSVLALAIAAGATACGAAYRGSAVHDPAELVHTLPPKQAAPSAGSLRSASCFMGYINQNQTGTLSTFSPGLPNANGYEVTLTNRDSGQSATVSSVSVQFFGSSGAKVGSDTVSIRTMHVAPGQSLTVIFYGPTSGYVALDNPYPGEWVSDRSMPSGARHCQVAKW